jgi:hypothetical protein
MSLSAKPIGRLLPGSEREPIPGEAIIEEHEWLRATMVSRPLFFACSLGKVGGQFHCYFMRFWMRVE